MFKELFSPTNTFIYGFVLCGIFLAQSWWAHFKTKRELKRYKGMLSDKLELDSKQNQDVKKEQTTLKQENENLRMQVARLNERPDNKLQRELEILARAEKQMVISAPGFAPAWEMAKSTALSQLEEEEKGKSFPQKVFRKLIGSGSSQSNVALPESAASAAKNGTPAASAA
jgi:predicted nuclease with TOPRIM domain